MAAEPVEIEVPSFDTPAPAFLEWAGQDADGRVVYGPDPILAVDCDPEMAAPLRAE